MNLKLDKPLVFFDLETTGTDIRRDRIIEIYAKKLNTDGTIDEYYQLFNPIVPISEDATDVHGHTNENLEEYPTFGEKSVEIYNFFKDCDYGGYNCIRFDIPFLMEELLRHKQPFYPIKSNFIDPYKIISKMDSNKLGDVYKRYFGEELENAHQATSDVDATIRIFEEQIKKYKLSSVSEISDLVRSDDNGNKFIDFGGVFYKKLDCYYYGVGKYRGDMVGDHMSYLDWMVNTSDMPINVKIVANILKNYYKKNK